MTICLIIHKVYCNSKVSNYQNVCCSAVYKDSLYFWIEIMHTNDSFPKQHLWYHIFHDLESENNSEALWKIVVRMNNWGIVGGGYTICCHDNTITYQGREWWLVVENEWTFYESCYLVERCDVWQQQSITRKHSQ